MVQKLCVAIPLLLAPLPTVLAQDEPYLPRVEPASSEGVLAIEGFTLAEGFTATLWASEPHLANPVCLAIDTAGRVFVAETFRHHAGVTDMREHMDWLDDDLANRTVEERVEMIRRHEGERFSEYAQEHERVRRIVDTDGDGVADTSTVFADGFKHPAAGIGAGLLPHEGSVYYTCIPDLWRLDDDDGDGVAETRRLMHTGFGVNIALLGHDLHGLRMGPDGRLYFSIGDRGFHVETEGRVLAHPHAGAVLRCETDGSGLEVYATGLRNPQELVFDDHGNLFTGDNNSDGGDRARWVWVLEGGDSGWRYSYQWITRPNLRGPWNAEKQWHPHHAGQPAFLNPPIANFTDGPSGLAYYPGTGWGADWRGRFLLCDFRGTPGLSGIHAFENARKGAGFELVEAQKFLWNVLATDCDFGPDGSLYVSDWVAGWNKTGKGRVYRVAPDGWPGEEAAATQAILAAGMGGLDRMRLQELLAHADQRVRLAAQLELAKRAILIAEPATAWEDALCFIAVAVNKGAPELARLHALWGIGHVARRREEFRDQLMTHVGPLWSDPDPEVRAQVLGLFGENRRAERRPLVEKRLLDDDPRVRLFAAQCLGKLGRVEAIPPLFDAIEANDDADPWLRHAAIWALVSIGDRDAVLARAGDASTSVRRAVVVALRRWHDPRVARFLGDADPTIAAEAVRAIHDERIDGAMESLAARLAGPLPEDAYTLRRLLNANNLVGDEPSAARVAALISHPDCPSEARVEALRILADWTEPTPRDRVMGEWRPLGERAAPDLASFFEANREPLYSWSERAQLAWVELCRRQREHVPDVDDELRSLRIGVAERRLAARARRDALELAVQRWNELRSDWHTGPLGAAFDDPDGAVRVRAYELFAASDPEAAIERLSTVVLRGRIEHKQEAVRSLSKIDSPLVAPLLAGWLGDLANAELPSAIGVELVEAAEARDDDSVQAALARYYVESFAPDDPLRDWRVALVGGDAEAGRRVFLEKAETTCLKCHAMGDEGGSEAGPDLSDVGDRLTRVEILHSIVEPNASIAEGFETWLFATADGGIVVGRILEETADVVRVETQQKEVVELDPEEIETRKRDVSAMAEDVSTHLTRREMRDLVEFLSGQRKP